MCIRDRFGDVLPQIEKITLPLRHAGQYEDREVNLFYNYFRFYDPASGRYIENDPIDLTGGLNRWGYVGGSPLLATDPKGLFLPAIPVAIAIGEAIGAGVAAFINAAPVAATVGVGVVAMSIPSDTSVDDTKAKPTICDVEPDDLCEQLALAEAKAGAGYQIMGKMGDEPRLIAHYGAGPWVKKEHKHICNDGKQKVIHYFHSLTTGKNVELKFKKR